MRFSCHAPSPQQTVCKGLRRITRHHMYSMVALHIPASQYHDWAVAMDEATFHAVPGQIVIGTSSPTAYSPTIVHKPLRASDTFYLFKNKEAARPTHNAFALGAHNQRGKWRGYWCDLQVLPPKLFNKQKDELLVRAEPASGLENPEGVKPEQTSFFNSAKDKMCTVPEFINQGVKKIAKKRTQFWRKEQLSQGVLDRLLACIGRVTTCQVTTRAHTLTLHRAHATPTPILPRNRWSC